MLIEQKHQAPIKEINVLAPYCGGNVFSQVAAVICKRPSRENLFELLRLVEKQQDDEITMETVENGPKRSKLYKALRVQLHPDKHPNNPQATKLFQNLDPFYTNCVLTLGHHGGSVDRRKSHSSRKALSRSEQQNKLVQRKKKTSPPPSTNRFPPGFDVRNKWPQIDFDRAYTPPKVCTEIDISSIIAYQCMNARGAIAHNRKITRYLSTKELKGPCHAREIFDGYGGCVHLRTSDEIKREIMIRGPVVSVSFAPTELFMSTNQQAKVLVPPSPSLRRHAVLISGWKQTSFGEIWLVESFRRYPSMMESSSIQVAAGQFGIDDECIAPMNDFLSIAWDQEPAFDADLSNHPDWETFTGIKLSISSDQLEKLGDCFTDGSFINAVAKKSRFVIRDSCKIARSKPCYLKDVQWTSGVWKIWIRFF